MRRPSAVLWDMDGTLLGTEELHLECWEQLCEQKGICNARAVFLLTVGRNQQDTDAILRREFGEDFDVPHHRALKNELFKARIEKGIPVKEGVLDSLDYLKGKSVPMAVASSTNKEQVLRHLTSARIEQYFSAIVGGDEISRGKPHPEIFQRAASSLGCSAADTLAVEDSPNGVLSASAAGAKVLLVPDLVEPTEEIRRYATYVRGSLREAFDLLRELFP